MTADGIGPLPESPKTPPPQSDNPTTIYEPDAAGRWMQTELPTMADVRDELGLRAPPPADPAAEVAPVDLGEGSAAIPLNAVEGGTLIDVWGWGGDVADIVAGLNRAKAENGWPDWFGYWRGAHRLHRNSTAIMEAVTKALGETGWCQTPSEVLMEVDCRAKDVFVVQQVRPRLTFDGPIAMRA